jgi:hypothetical protein
MAKVKTAEPILYKTAVPPVLKHTSPSKAFNQVGEKRAGSTKYPDYETKPVGVSNKVSEGTKRAGNNHVAATGRPGAVGECPVTSGK